MQHREDSSTSARDSGIRRAHPVIRVCASLVILMALLVLVGWFTHQTTLIQVLPTLVPMQFNTALGFLLCGLALLLLSAGRKTPGLVAASIAGLGGLLTLVEYTAGVDLHIDQLFMDHYITVETSHPGRMAPNTALCFVLSAAAMILLSTRGRGRLKFFVSGTFSALTTALGFTAFTGYLSGLHTAYGWGNLTRMAVHTSVGFVALGVGLLALSWITTRKGDRPFNWLPASAAIMFLTLAVSVWQAQESGDHRRVNELTRVAANGIAESIEVSVRDVVNALDRMARRWENHRGSPEDVWRLDASAHVAHFPGVLAMEWVSPDFEVRWAEPEAGNEMVLGLNLAADPRRRPILEMAREKHVPVVTPVMATVQGGDGFYVAAPITVDGEFGGFMLAVVELGSLIPAVVPNLEDDFAFRIFEDGRQVLEKGDWAAARATTVGHAAAQLPGERTWTISATPARSLTDANHMTRDALTLGAGILMALMAAFVVALAQISRDRAVALEHHQQHLEELVELRTASLKESEARFQRLMGSAPIPMAHVNADGEIVFFNERFNSTFGYSPDEIPTEKDWWEKAYPDPDYRRQVLETWAGAVESADQEQTEITPNYYNVTCRDGTVREMEISGVKLGDEFLATLLDVTERNRLMRAMTERVKEMTCLYAVAEAVRTGESPEPVCRDIVRLIPTGWQYPDLAVAQIQLDDLTIESDGYEETEWTQKVEISSRGETRGEVRVCYLEPKPERDHGVFLKEETALLEEIAGLVGDYLTRSELAEETRKTRDRFRSLYENVPVSLWDEDWTAIIERVRGLDLPPDTDFHTYFESNMDVVQACLQDVVINDVNAETLRLFEADSKEKMLRSLETVFNTPDTLPGFVGELAALAAGRTEYETEMLLNTVTGDRITVLLKMTFPPPGADHGQVLVSLPDISDLKRIQREIERERRISESVVDSLPGVFYQIRPDASFARWNSRFETVTGYTADELGTMKATELFRGDDAKRVADAMQQVFLQGEATVEANLVGKDGAAAPYLFNGKLFDIDGEPFLVGMGLDVTDMKQVEKHLRATNRELERFNTMAVGREKRMIELKRVINGLQRELGRKPPYDLAFADEEPEGRPS